jgi:hypothetical protein
MDIDTVSFIEQTSTLHNHIVENKIINVIVKELQDIPELKNLKMSLDLLLHIALMLENLTHDNKLSGRPKGFKVDMCIKIFEKLGFINREEDKQFITNGLNFLHSAGKIKRLGFFKRLFAKIYRVAVKNAIG